MLQYPHLKNKTLRLIKVQVKYLGRKWKNANVAVIGLIYNSVTPVLDERYLTDADIDAEKALV